MGMVIIGVTGGIGAGKSSVSAILGQLGARVLDADVITRQVSEPHQEAWKQIVSVFGPGILNADTTINKRELARIVFLSDSDKKMLEAILHEKVLHEMELQVAQLREEGFTGMVVMDVPIPVEDGFLNKVHEVWVVVASDEERIRRIVNRSGLTANEARARMDSQLSQQDYMKLGHKIIHNDCSLAELKDKVEELYNEVMGNITQY